MTAETPTSDAARRPLAAIILAAGKGTRMRSDLPKVAHEVAGRPMITWVADAVRAAGASRIVLVDGHAAEVVRECMAGDDADVEYVMQAEQLGTGHAVMVCDDAFAGWSGDVLVLAGDGPLIRPSTIEAMLERHRADGAAATLATSIVDDPTGYGRVIRDAEGGFGAIIEQKNATPEQLAVREIYPSYACFDAEAMFDQLRRLEKDPVGGEYYVTELPAMLKASGATVAVVDAVPPEDVLSINTPEQLGEVDTILRRRLAEAGE
jgi:UDP-N-acetylglucosamine diphosphorylase/glucosamine-1-phosphate N-acetyltransferase